MTLNESSSSFKVTRSFAFLDLCGFTDHLDLHGSDDAMAEVRLLRSTVRDVAPMCAIRVDKWLGDGVMLVGVEPERLITAVLTITERIGEAGRLPVRAGIATGEVLLLEGDDYIGRTVNLASRLCDRAQKGEVLAAGENLLLPDGVTMRRPRSLHIRGFREPVTVRSLVVEDAYGDEPWRPARGATAFASMLEHMFRPAR